MQVFKPGTSYKCHTDRTKRVQSKLQEKWSKVCASVISLFSNTWFVWTINYIPLDLYNRSEKQRGQTKTYNFNHCLRPDSIPNRKIAHIFQTFGNPPQIVSPKKAVCIPDHRRIERDDSTRPLREKEQPINRWLISIGTKRGGRCINTDARE